MKTWADYLFHFYASLRPAQTLPNNVQWLYPQRSEEVMAVVQRFLRKYFNDKNKRRLLLGINHGRFGAGTTGINFTAAKQLTEVCGIKHPFPPRTELSAEFIYAVIRAYGGPDAFYKKFFIGSVCPLGFLKNGVNVNYYDDRALQEAVTPFITQTIEDQLTFPVDRSVAYAIGGEKNFKFLRKLNEGHKWFGEVVPLPHPRFIMQYRRKQLQPFIQFYLDALKRD